MADKVCEADSTPDQAPASDSYNGSTLRSGATVVFLQGDEGKGTQEQADGGVGVGFMQRNGSTTVYLTGGINPALLKLEGTDPLHFLGRGVIQLLPPSSAAQEGTLPFVLTASATLEDGTLPFPLTDGQLRNMSIPLRLQSGRALPYEITTGNGEITFNPVGKSGCTKVALAMTGTGNLALPHTSDLAQVREVCEEGTSSEPRNGAVVIFLDGMQQESSKSDDGNIVSSATLSSGSTTVLLRSGSNSVLLTGGLQAPLAVADGTLPIPLTGVGMLRLERPEGGDGTSLSEGTLPFALTGQGRLKIPNQWLSDGTLPLPRAKDLVKQLALDFIVQSGLTLPRGLKGTGKLTIPEPEDGGNPWPSIPKDMLPWVLTGSGTVNLADGTWPLPIFEMEDRIIPIKRIVDETRSTAEPVQPDDSAPSIIPGPTKVGPDPVNPDDIPAVDVNPIGPSEAGPDPVNPEDRKVRACCGGQ